MIMPYDYSRFMMKVFCRKSVHHHFVLGLSSSGANVSPPPPPSSKCGLGLIANDTPRVPNVIESSSVVRPASAPTKKKDPGGIGFIDDIGGGVDGLMSCTESLGFESCDERRVDDDDDDDNGGDKKKNCDQRVEVCEGKRSVMMTRDAWRRRRKSEEKRERKNKKFPPPLSSLNQNGQPCFYLKPVRTNGRLELTEVRIERPEILRAVRQNGRLRLHLVSSDVCSRINEVEEEETEQEEQEQELHLQEEEEEEVKLQEEEEEEERKVEELWKYRVNGEGFRRCHEPVMTHHHHHDYHHHPPNINDHHHSLHVWRQPCVTTR
ncbi:uncharacterized protein LOC110415882 [Herrania umbratica]|uniref:Uncharacterized protein LOC110415882 n=1 Tax=Herrania umbratica TaxID=108875 RepID=A0A6J1A855_9ROSI|nr:uncharacterized protein LOC110415882 [Herrania umbratica]